VRIAGRDSDASVIVIAELGNNHEGDPEVALELVRAAAAARADGVKLQTFDPHWFVRPDNEARMAQMERFRLADEDLVRIRDLAHAEGLLFLSAPLDMPSVELLEPLVDAYKIASGDNDVPQLLERVADTRKPMVVSTGMSDLAGIRAAKEIVESRWAALGHDGELAILHCVSAYPAPAERAALATIPMLAGELGVTVGYSDHTLGIDACVAAVAAGARVLEKHLTLRHDYSEFRDHQLSAEPEELAELVRRVRGVETLLGEPQRDLVAEEKPVAEVARRSLVAARDLPAGHVLGAGDLTWMRPRDGLPPAREPEVLGRALKRALAFAEPVSLDDLD
jgi:N,N'-diacetyllegionaminate synthase